MRNGIYIGNVNHSKNPGVIYNSSISYGLHESLSYESAAEHHSNSSASCCGVRFLPRIQWLLMVTHGIGEMNQISCKAKNCQVWCQLSSAIQRYNVFGVRNHFRNGGMQVGFLISFFRLIGRHCIKMHFHGRGRAVLSKITTIVNSLRNIIFKKLKAFSNIIRIKLH